MEVKERALKESGSCPVISRPQQHHSSGPRKAATVTTGGGESMRRAPRPRPPLLSKRPAERSPQQFLVQGKPLVNPCYPYGDGPHQPGFHAIGINKKKPPKDVKENREDPEKHISVVVRIRPKRWGEEMCNTIVFKTRKLNEDEDEQLVEEEEDDDTTLVFDPKPRQEEFYFKGKRQILRNDFGKKRPNKNLYFQFDYVYGQDSTNQEVFEISLNPLIGKVLAGFNCTVFAYGATGSGKTYTMLGAVDTPGVTVLMAEELFRRLNAMTSEEFTFEIKVSYLEVYNETIKDLLNPNKELSIREDGRQGLCIPQLTVHTPKCPQELLKLLQTGNSARSQHATDYNAESSRSHAVFEITVLMHRHTERFKRRTATSRLCMVDLAGSEKGSMNVSSPTPGLRQREGANINKSLLALSNCINALVDGKTHIPFRNSKLTRILKDSLSGNCVTVMIANVSPADSTFEDTQNTLHYAFRARAIKVDCKQNGFSEELVEKQNGIRISDLQCEVRLLTKRLSEEMQRHQETKDLLQHHRGHGDGVATFIPPPTAVESADELIPLLEQRSELSKAVTEAEVALRLHSFQTFWKKAQLDIGELVGRPLPSDSNFKKFVKLRNSESELSMHLPTLQSLLEDRQSQLSAIKTEMEDKLPDDLNMPFLTLTFGEFLKQKEMEARLIRAEALFEYHQQIEANLFLELKNAQIHRLNLANFLKERIDNADVGLLSLLKPIYDPQAASSQKIKPHKRFNLQEDFQTLQMLLEIGDEALPPSNIDTGRSSEMTMTMPPAAAAASRLIDDTSAKDTSIDSVPQSAEVFQTRQEGDRDRNKTYRVRKQREREPPTPVVEEEEVEESSGTTTPSTSSTTVSGVPTDTTDSEKENNKTPAKRGRPSQSRIPIPLKRGQASTDIRRRGLSRKRTIPGNGSKTPRAVVNRKGKNNKGPPQPKYSYTEDDDGDSAFDCN